MNVMEKNLIKAFNATSSYNRTGWWVEEALRMTECVIVGKTR